MKTTDVTVNEKDIEVVYGNQYCPGDVSENALCSVKYLYSDLTDIRKHYIRLGFHLDEFQSSRYYLEFGFATFEDFCQVNLGMDKGAVSRCINVYREFNASGDRYYEFDIISKGCHMELSDRWKDYSYTQLCELLPLSPEDRRKVTPDMSVKQIREFKKQLKKKQNAFDGVESVASTQPKLFDYDEYLNKSGIVEQNYIKKCARAKIKVLYLFDSRGKRVTCGDWCDVLLDDRDHVVIRLRGECDPVELTQKE